MKKPLKILLAAGAAGLVVLGACALYKSTGEDLEQRRAEAVREAVLRTARECYAVEGIYPPTLAYLEEHYGLMVNHKRYIITYECYASNQTPDVMVLRRR